MLCKSHYRQTKTLQLVIVIISLFIISCNQTSKISGTVFRIRGNQMPSPDLAAPIFPGFQTNIYFFELAKITDTKGGDGSGMYQEITKPLIAIAQTDADGKFKIRLKPGQYSVLIGNEKLFYTNRSDSEGHLNPLTVVSGTRQRLELHADWDALY